MKKLLSNSYLNLAIRLFAGIAFVFAAIPKIDRPELFASEILNYRFFPDFAINFVALVVPWIELIAGLSLIAGARIKASAAALAILDLFFIIAILAAMAQGLNINCGCHTAFLSEKVGLTKLLENFGILALLAFVYFSKGDKFSVEKRAVNERLKPKSGFFSGLN